MPAEIANLALHEVYMRQALAQAELAEQRGEVPVGAVVVLEQKIIAAAYNQNISLHDPCAHAEILALRAAGVMLGNHRLLGAQLYVTLEPCLMCIGAMIHARIKEIIFGAFDSKTGACGSGVNALTLPIHNHQLNCMGGVLAQDCSHKLKAFFQAKR